MASKKRYILLDADVVIHFYKGGRLIDLKKIFPKNEKIILDIVNQELSKKHSFKQIASNLITYGIAKEVSINDNLKIYQEFARLKKTLGEGESACMAYCRYNDDILASSNLRDIKIYCEEHNIEYYTTMDFLYEAFQKEIFTEAECDEFIYNVKSQNSKLPVDTISEYIEQFIEN